MTASNVVAFYSEAHWGSRYGVIDSAHPTHHKGLDCGLFRGIVQVPALHSGTVVAVRASSSVGHYVTVQRATFSPLFDTYCHIVPGVSVGERVVQGTNLGRQAITKAEGGTAWLGQHTHLTLSDTLTGWAMWGAHNLDPTPGVIAALTGAASESSTPIINQVEQEEDTMQKPIVAHRTDGTQEWSLIAPWIVGTTKLEQGYKITTDSKVGDAWSRMYANGIGHATLEVTRDGGYVDAQNAARDLRVDYLAAIKRGEVA